MVERISLYVQPAYNYDTKHIDYIEVLVRGYRGFDVRTACIDRIR